MPAPYLDQAAQSLSAAYRLAATQHGLVSRRQLLSAGISSGRLARLASSQHWKRPSDEVYELIPLPETYGRRVALAYLSASENVTIIGCAALVLHGLLPTWRAEKSRTPIEIGTATGVTATSRALGQVCVSEFDIARSVEIDGFRVCSVERALLDACRILPRSVARDIIGEALRQQRTTRDAVLKTLRKGRRGGRLLRQIVNSFTEVDHDVFGRRFVEMCQQAQLPLPEAEVVLDLRYGDVSHIRLDFYWPTSNVAVELDGFAYHSTAADLRRDRERQNVIVQAGITLFRYTWSDITVEHQRTIRQLRNALSNVELR